MHLKAVTTREGRWTFKAFEWSGSTVDSHVALDEPARAEAPATYRTGEIAIRFLMLIAVVGNVERRALATLAAVTRQVESMAERASVGADRSVDRVRRRQKHAGR